MGRTLRVVVADGAGPLARQLRDTGHEVVCTGPLGADALAATCLQEDADAVGPPIDGLRAALDRLGLADVVVIEGAEGLL